MRVSDADLAKMTMDEVLLNFPGNGGEDQEIRKRHAKIKSLARGDVPDAVYKIPGFTCYDPAPVALAAIALRDRVSANIDPDGDSHIGRVKMSRILGLSAPTIWRIEMDPNYTPSPGILAAYASLADKMLMKEEAELFRSAGLDRFALYAARAKRKRGKTISGTASRATIDHEFEKRGEEK